MPTREDVLREKAHKDQGVDLPVRVFYTLSDGSQVHRSTKALSLLFGRLHARGILTDDDIDEILLECADWIHKRTPEGAGRISETIGCV